jgi:hypothetical protein
LDRFHTCSDYLLRQKLELSLIFLMTLLLTLAVCVTWAALTVCFCGIGVLWLRRLTGFKPCWRNAYLAVWAGFGLLMAGLLVWHFFLPVNERALLLFTLLSATSLILERRWIAATLSTSVSGWLVAAIGAFSAWTANHALAAGGMDDYNYEFQAIRWYHDYRIVPGLANLHGRIGFNNSHHLFAAMLSYGPWSGTVNHVFNGLFVVLAFILLAAAVRDLALGRMSSSAMLGGLLVSPCVGLVLFGIFGPMISTLKADVFMCAATAALAVLFTEFAETREGEERYLALAATIILLPAVLFSVKVTALVFCGILAPAAVFRLVRTVGWKHRVTISATVVAAVIFCSVLLRGVILSGYPLYPSTMLPVNVDWRVPVAQANAEQAYIISWAQLRATYVAVNGWAWIHPWVRSTVLTDKFTIVLPLVLAFLSVPSLVFALRRAQNGIASRWGWATLVTASMVSLAVWFIQAPSGRFGFIHFWIVFAVVFTIAFKGGNRTPGLILASATGLLALVAASLLFWIAAIPREFRSGMLLMLVFSFLWVNASGWVIARQRAHLLALLCLILGFFQVGDRLQAHVLRRRFADIGPLLWLPVATLPEYLDKSEYVPRQTRQGLIVYEARRARYDTPLPNTRFFDPALELRTPGDLSKGFRNPSQRDPARYGYSVQVVITGDSQDKEIVSPDK